MNALSVITMFFPRNSVIIATLLFGGFIFGLYIPWEERKKKKKKSPPGSAAGPAGRPAPQPEERSRNSQLDSLLEAGLLTREEYEQRKQQLLKK